METVKKTDDYTIVKKRSGRYGVRRNDNKWINGEEKVKVLLEAGLIEVKLKAPEPEAAPAESEETAEETPAEEKSE